MEQEGQFSVEYYVAPEGDDASPGTVDAPFASLDRARDAVLRLKARDGLPVGGVRIWLRGGTYGLDRSFVLGPADGGRSDAPVVYQAYPGEEAHLMGGSKVPSSSFAPVVDPEILVRLDAAAHGHVLQADLASLGIDDFGSDWPDRFKGYAGWMELFFDGAPMTLARWPNEGYAKVEGIVEPGSRPRYDEKPDRPGTFTYGGARPERWSTAPRVYLNGYWYFKWYDESLRVATIDAETRQITFAAPHRYGLGIPGDRALCGGASGGYYYAFNLLEELDAPGEYYVDRDTGSSISGPRNHWRTSR